MIDMNEVLQLQRKGEFAELTRRGVQITDGALGKKEGWAKAAFSGSRAHYYVEIAANAISNHGRHRLWKAVCGAEAETHDKAPMFGIGSYERCKNCLKKRNAARNRETLP